MSIKQRNVTFVMNNEAKLLHEKHDTFFKINFIIQILVFHVSNAHSSALDSTSHKLLLKGLHQVNIEEYNQALVTFEDLIKHRPQYPGGFLCGSSIQNNHTNLSHNRFRAATG